MLYVVSYKVSDENNPIVGFASVKCELVIEPAIVVIYMPLPPVSITVY